MLLHRFQNKYLFSKKNSLLRSIPPSIHIIPKDAILPDFLTNYIGICNLPDFAKPYANKIDCVQHLIVPTVDIQQEILDALQTLNEKINIQEITPYLMYYMVNNDIDKVNELLMAYQQYYQSLDYILSTLKDIGSV